MAGYNFYPLEKFTSAVQTLATSPEDIRARLKGAFVQFGGVKADDLPESARADYVRVRDMLTSKEPRHSGEGSIDASLYEMDDMTASEVAVNIFTIYHTIERSAP